MAAGRRIRADTSARRRSGAVIGEPTPSTAVLAGHPIVVDGEGRLMPWISWGEALDREMEFYQQCPLDHGYPRFAQATFLDGDWNPWPDRVDTIPATQNGMAIISYLKFHEFRARGDPRFLATACLLGDYLVNETLTPSIGKYPALTRSTGKRDKFPQPEDAGSQGDGRTRSSPTRRVSPGTRSCACSTHAADATTWHRQFKTRAFLRRISSKETIRGRRGRSGSIIAMAPAAGRFRGT